MNVWRPSKTMQWLVTWIIQHQLRHPRELCPSSSEITNAIAFCLAKDIFPLSTMSTEGFMKTVKTPDKRYVIPQCSYFSELTKPALYAKCCREDGKLSHSYSVLCYFEFPSHPSCRCSKWIERLYTLLLGNALKWSA